MVTLKVATFITFTYFSSYWANKSIESKSRRSRVSFLHPSESVSSGSVKSSCLSSSTTLFFRFVSFPVCHDDRNIFTSRAYLHIYALKKYVHTPTRGMSVSKHLVGMDGDVSHVERPMPRHHGECLKSEYAGRVSFSLCPR